MESTRLRPIPATIVISEPSRAPWRANEASRKSSSSWLSTKRRELSSGGTPTRTPPGCSRSAFKLSSQSAEAAAGLPWDCSQRI